ncbi:MAG TPA: hypothetical protein VFD46_00965 [Chryseolinea sp.]|nr:hypothetical protein [Chryseolinea sp.]
MEKITVFDYMEDFNDESLSSGEWEEVMTEAVQNYNEDHGADYKPKTQMILFKQKKDREKFAEPTF